MPMPMPSVWSPDPKEVTQYVSAYAYAYAYANASPYGQ